MQTHLYDGERSLPEAIFHERIARELEHLRRLGEDWPQTAQAYVAGWLSEGHLERRFPPGASEEEYELSTSTIEAIRFVAGQVKPHSAATESRLGLVINALARLAEDTDADKTRRIQRLRAEQERIERDIAAIEQGVLHILPETAALERTREIITLADGLAGDFRRVRSASIRRSENPALTGVIGGMGDISAPVQSLAGIPWQPSTVIIVENLQTGLALEDIPGAVAFMGWAMRLRRWRRCRGSITRLACIGRHRYARLCHFASSAQPVSEAEIGDDGRSDNIAVFDVMDGGEITARGG
jgi:hypothetical protein